MKRILRIVNVAQHGIARAVHERAVTLQENREGGLRFSIAARGGAAEQVAIADVGQRSRTHGPPNVIDDSLN